MYKVGNSVEQVYGGSVVKQGDRTPFGFVFRDEAGETVNIKNATIKIKIANGKALLLEKNGVLKDDYTVEFSLGQADITGSGDMRLEFTVTYSSGLQEKFPSDDWQRIKITPTLDDITQTGIAYLTFEKMKADFTQKVDDLNNRVDNIVAESGNSNIEIMESRKDIYGDIFTTLKARLDKEQRKLENIIRPNVFIENFNPDATGTNLTTQPFLDAVSYANSVTRSAENPANLVLSPGTYRIKKTADLLIPSLKCLVGYATIIVEDAFAFVVASNFELSHVKIVSKNTYAKTEAIFKPIFKATSTIENVTLENVIFDSVLSSQDGTVRASVAANFLAVKNLKMRNIEVKGYRYGILTNGLSDGINGNDLRFYNTELPLYMRGSDPAVTDENYSKNIQFDNIVHINTKTQSQNYYKQAGADTILLEKCDTITLGYIVSEWPVERSCYLSCCRNLVASVWQLKNALGLKCVGGSNTTTGLETIAYGFDISNIHAVFDDPDITQQGYIAEFYWAKKATVKGCSIRGNGIASVGVSMRHYAEDIIIEDCFGDNLKRGFVEYSYVGDIINPAPTPSIAAGTYTSGFKKITVRKNTVYNSNTLDYDVVKLSDASPPAAGTYRYEDIRIEDNTVVNPVDDYGMVANGNYCKGLINIDSVNGLSIKNNKMIGHKRTDANGNIITLPFQVGPNSKNVVIIHEETVHNPDFKYVWGTLYMSADSKIIINNVHRNFSYQDIATITIKHDSSNLRTTKDLSMNFRISGRTSISDTTDFSLPLIGYSASGYTLPNLFGVIDIITDAGDTGGYTITKAGLITLKSGSSAFFVTSTTDAKYALVKDGTLPRYLMRFKLGAAATSFIVNYSINAS
ncbi:hypothetical protein LRO89_01020 [Priestia megaterium]|uniref:hypothetical protein n=1 Tax=Priestia megaterium TaxID=1404 RepID=UPI0039C4B047